MITTKTELVRKEGKRSYLRRVIKYDNGQEVDRFIVPVIDVRDGEKERDLIKAQVKANSQSKFLRPSFSESGRSYQTSYKSID